MTHINQLSGIYIRGQAYPFTKKLEVAVAYQAMRGASGTGPNIAELHHQFRVSKGVIKMLNGSY